LINAAIDQLDAPADGQSQAIGWIVPTKLAASLKPTGSYVIGSQRKPA